MTMFDLSGRVAVVTGGNGGIGLGMARGLAAAGTRVVVAARNAEKAAAAVAELGTQSTFIALDVADESSCRAAIDQTEKRFGRVDILVNNAGTSIRKPPETYTAAEWHAVLDVNLTGAFLCSQAAHPVMKRSGGGKIINIGSMFALFGSAYAAPYAASKGALVQLTKSLAAAWAADNIQVNAVLPGWIDTELTRDARQQVAGLHERVLARTPAGRWGVPEDLAGIASSSPLPPPTSSPALRSRSMAASPRWVSAPTLPALQAGSLPLSRFRRGAAAPNRPDSDRDRPRRQDRIPRCRARCHRRRLDLFSRDSRFSPLSLRE
jgi:2-dehydro-3-deoxy-D-gluconate 5-dehydrogenase